MAITATSTERPDVDFNAQTALDIEAARINAKLNVSAVRVLLHGSESAWKARERVMEILSNDPVFDKSYRHYWTRKETFEKSLAMQNRYEELRHIHGWNEMEMHFVDQGVDETTPIIVHKTAFETTITSQGSEDLNAKLGPLIRNRGILGCYLQTELGHGSNVSQLETTATYIPESEEFEIHSPTLTSTKWWPGGLGKTANYAVVQAQLILPVYKNMGPHLFLVQLRSMDTHEVLPGMKIGDIGPKAMGGYASEDNGYARFDHVRIPRAQMLSKFAQVTKEGVYVKPPHSKLSYGTMVSFRAERMTYASYSLAKAAIISLRYATVRRQGNSKGSLECQIITYPSIHCRLLPILSRAYVYTLLSRILVSSYRKLTDQLHQEDISFLPDMHAITSGLKGLATTVAAQDLEVARRAMGGNGYSAYAGLGREYANHLASVTFEGENFILDTQVVRGALKAYHQPSSSYLAFYACLRLLREEKSNSQLYVFETPDWKDPQVVIKVLEWRAAKAVQARAVSQEAGTVDGSSDQRISRAISEAYVATQVGDIMSSLNREELGKESETILKSLFHLYLLSTAEAALVDLLALRVISPHESEGKKKPAEALRLELAHHCAMLVPEAISLTDAFGYNDWELDSAIGVYDGRVYEELWRRVQTEPLNQTDVTDAYQSALKPLLERGRALAYKETKFKL